jgi:hypothetical protein
MLCAVYRLRHQGVKLSPEEIKATALTGTLRVTKKGLMGQPVKTATLQDATGRDILPPLRNAHIDTVDRGGLMVHGGVKVGGCHQLLEGHCGEVPQDYLVSGAAISETRWKSLTPFRPGQTVRQVQRLLGTPAADDSGLKAWYGTETSGVSFKVSHGQVVAVIYQCYTG